MLFELTCIVFCGAIVIKSIHFFLFDDYCRHCDGTGILPQNDDDPDTYNCEYCDGKGHY